MYVRVTRSRFDPAKSDDVVRLATPIGAAVRGLPGCQSYQGGIDRDGGRSIAISTFDTVEHARFSRDTLGDSLGQLLAIGVQLDPPDIYELVD